MKALACILVLLLAGCATPAPPPCPPLPMPTGTSRAARDAHALSVIELYAQCAARSQP